MYRVEIIPAGRPVRTYRLNLHATAYMVGSHTYTVANLLCGQSIPPGGKIVRQIDETVSIAISHDDVSGRPGRNVWVRTQSERVVERCISETRPDGDDWWPLPAMSRVRGLRYTPYTGDTEWAGAANEILWRECKARRECAGLND